MKQTTILRRVGMTIALLLTFSVGADAAFAKKKTKAVEATTAPAEATPAPAAEAPAAEEENLEDLPVGKGQCKKDIETHCAKVAFGNNQIASCLRNQREQVSEPCRKSLFDYLKKRFDRACKTDVKKHCQKESTQQGALMPCLQQHAQQLSDGCQEMMGLKKPAAAPAAAPAK